MLDKDNFYYKQSNANLKRRLRELSGTKKKKAPNKKKKCWRKRSGFAPQLPSGAYSASAQ
jgi:hypothetical protein